MVKSPPGWLHVTAPRWESEIDVRFLEDGHLVEVLDSVVFIDSRGFDWRVFAGTKVDGSSIPRLLRSIVGTPFVGKHRKASVPHDLYCRIRTQPCSFTHYMYYEACIVSGCSGSEARRKYWAIRRFGPRW